jgi:hypothetical protein
MPFNVGEVINGFADSVLKAPIVGTIAANPIYTAMLITLIVVLIVMFAFREADTTESLLVICLRSGFWIFLLLTSILFVHNKVLTQDHHEDIRSESYKRIFNNKPKGVPVIPGAVDASRALDASRVVEGSNEPRDHGPAHSYTVIPHTRPIRSPLADDGGLAPRPLYDGDASRNTSSRSQTYRGEAWQTNDSED